MILSWRSSSEKSQIFNLDIDVTDRDDKSLLNIPWSIEKGGIDDKNEISLEIKLANKGVDCM